MALDHLLQKSRRAIVERWLRLIVETYPAETSKLLWQEKDRFANPVGWTISQEMEALYDALLQGAGEDKLSLHLERVLQIRSVQDFSPSQAVVIIPLLKKAVREEMKRSGVGIDRMMEEWFDLESKIDQLSLIAFDIYMKYRERIYEVRLDEAKRERDRAFKLLERTRLVHGENSNSQ